MSCSCVKPGAFQLFLQELGFQGTKYHLLSTIHVSLGGYQILNVHPYGRILFCIELAIDSLGFLHFDLEEAF